VQQTYFAYASSATANGDRHRVSPAIFYYYKAIGAFAEYMRSTQRVAKGSSLTDVTNDAWDITGSIFVTGEAASDRLTRPKANFDPSAGTWGALQLLARYSRLKVDDAAFRAGLAAANASGEAKQFTIAANWFPTPYIKYYLTYERTRFNNSSV